MTQLNRISKRLKPFKYYSPTSIGEAVSLLQEYGDRVKVLAGGTDLLCMMKLRAANPECVLGLKGIAGLSYIREEEKRLRIGALTQIAAFVEDDLVEKKYISLHEAAVDFATPQVRNMATIGGNICRSSPGADMVPPLTSLGAELRLVGSKGERKVLLEDFISGAGQNILDGEILIEIIVPPQEGRYGTAFAKLSRNSADLAKVNCAAKVIISGPICENLCIILGAVADRPVRAKRVEGEIKGKKVSEEIIKSASKEVIKEITPITDARSTAEYRLQVSQVLINRVVMQAIHRAG
ncbi:MAG: xanthine dehydrogenase family protein subunit M [Deltaproteobacteria bacterium]